MTVSLDARTPSAELHCLIGSTPPSSGPALQPFAIRTVPAANVDDTFVPLCGAAADVVAGLAARRPVADPDAELIELAGRIVVLAAREERLTLRQSRIDDDIQDACPPIPPMPERPGVVTLDDTTVDGVHVQTCVLRTDEQAVAAFQKALEERTAKIAEIESLVEHEAQRRGVPKLKKLRYRMYRRLVRWSGALTAMDARTPAGIRAKVAAQLAVEKGGNEGEWTTALAASVSRDALRLINIGADRWAEREKLADGALISIGRAWEASRIRLDRADADLEAAADSNQRPDIPPGLLWRGSDGTGLGPYPLQDLRTGAWHFGYERTIASLRANISSGCASVRHVEIVDAYDYWVDAVRAEDERSGYTAARAEVDAASDEARALREQICMTPARTAAGIELKIQVALWCLGGVEGLAEDLRPGDIEHPGTGSTMALSLLLDLAPTARRHAAGLRARRPCRVSAPIDAVMGLLIAGAASFTTVLLFLFVIRNWGAGIERRLEAIEGRSVGVRATLADMDATPRARAEARADAFEEAAQHLYGLKGQGLPADDLLPIIARFFLRAADRGRGEPYQQSASNPATAAQMIRRTRLTAAAGDALNAYRAISGRSCWNARDKHAFAELERHSARCSGEAAPERRGALPCLQPCITEHFGSAGGADAEEVMLAACTVAGSYIAAVRDPISRGVLLAQAQWTLSRVVAETAARDRTTRRGVRGS